MSKAGTSANMRRLRKKPSPPGKSASSRGRKGKQVDNAGNLSSRPLARPQGDLPDERVPLVLTVVPDGDYALIDSGNGRKLERYGDCLIDRPEAQALWLPRLARDEWKQCDAVFTGNTDEEGLGRWIFPDRSLDETWPMTVDGMNYLGRFTSFRHVGVFPEQKSHWHHMTQLIERRQGNAAVLNLFGYTGIASLLAARAGATVTHVDASRKAIGWARENQAVAGLESKAIRWICDDATRFVEREVRRGKTYDIILLDPPAFGRGPKGEIWQLFDNLPYLLHLCRAILSNEPLAVILTAYSIRASFYALHTLMRERFAGMGGFVESGELLIAESQSNRLLPTSLFSRWVLQ